MTLHGTGKKPNACVRASPAEWGEWRRLADADGIALNAWLRRTINEGAELARQLEAMRARESKGGM